MTTVAWRWVAMAVAVGLLVSACTNDPSVGDFRSEQLGAATIAVPNDWVLLAPSERDGDFAVQAQAPDGQALLFGVARDAVDGDVEALLAEQEAVRQRELPGFADVQPRAIDVFNGSGAAFSYTYASDAAGVRGRGVDVVALGPEGAAILLSVTATDDSDAIAAVNTIVDSIAF